MNVRFKALVASCVMVWLSACAPMSGREAPQPVSETEALQKATSLAIGNLAWESVHISDVSKENGKTKWVGLTRSNKYVCAADLNGDNSYCDIISLAPPPQMPRPAPAAQAAANGPRAMAL